MSYITPSNTPKPRKERPLIYDFSTLDTNGEPVWYFLSIPESRAEEFMTTINVSGINVDIKQFGKILASGKGENAPESVRKEIMEKYATAS